VRKPTRARRSSTAVGGGSDVGCSVVEFIASRPRRAP
jgi:hypothetical protein